jgi:hypothetical protein
MSLAVHPKTPTALDNPGIADISVSDTLPDSLIIEMSGNLMCDYADEGVCEDYILSDIELLIPLYPLWFLLFCFIVFYGAKKTVYWSLQTKAKKL